ncbi:MAG: RnfABCDGE type electron transport complex subunit B [Pseudomonadota bacterium]
MTVPGARAAPDGEIADLAVRLDALLPQTQCTRCGYPACLPYAEAIARGEADIDRCPPGGDEGAAALARAAGRAIRPVDRTRGEPGPLRVALIDEAACIGCTICIRKCPVDAIVGAAKRMHTVLGAECTGCELCVAPCPVDCITMVELPPQAARFVPETARERHRFRQVRLAREPADRARRFAQAATLKLAELDREPPRELDAATARRRAIVERALARAHARLAGEPSDESP